MAEGEHGGGSVGNIRRCVIPAQNPRTFFPVFRDERASEGDYEVSYRLLAPFFYL
jgi:hypothetical protein